MENSTNMPAEDLLRQLLTHFFVTADGHLEWMYGEGGSVKDLMGADFEQALAPYLSEAAIANIQAAQAPGS